MSEAAKATSRRRRGLGRGAMRETIGRLRWHESWIVRAAILTAFVILCGYLASVTIAIQGIQMVSRIAYDPAVENLLNEHLDSIKTAYGLRQEIYLARLERVIPPQYRSQGPIGAKVSAEDVKKWLQLARFDELVNLDEIDVSELSGDEEAKLATAAMKPVHWTSRSALRVFNFLIGLPEGRIRRDFIIAEELKQRYQMIQATWEDQIRPTFVKANILIMFVTFALLVASLFVMARGLRRRMSQLLDGFRIWSERDSHYRFDKAAWSGELRAVAVQFNRMADEVDANRQRSLYLEKMASWQVIARKLAHEIKNPLTPIQMMVSQLSRHYKGDDPEFKKILDEAQTIITEEVAGLRRMVDHFSRFARLPEARFGRHDLKTLCQHAIELEKATFPQHEFRFECALGQVMATIDDHLMRQVLINLLKNAAEAIGAARGVITVRVLANFSDYLIEIEDNGSGVPADIKERVFEAYFTTKHTGPSPGMGLGLAVCQKVVMDHGGEIAVVSEPGRTVFTVRLPIKFEGGIHESSGT